MWKIAILVGVAILIPTKGDAPEPPIDRQQVIDAIDLSKDDIVNFMNTALDEKGFHFGEQGKNNLLEYITDVARDMSQKLDETAYKLSIILTEFSDAMKQTCDLPPTVSLDEPISLTTNDYMHDCFLSTVRTALQHFQLAFRGATDGRIQLNNQKTLAKTCSNDNCRQILNDVNSITNNTLAYIAAEHKEYVDTIGNTHFIDHCFGERMRSLVTTFANLFEKIRACANELNENAA